MRTRQLISVVLAAGILISNTGALSPKVKAAENKPEALTQEKVDKENNKYNNNENAVIEFISMSDTHVASYESKKWAFENIGAWSEKIGFAADTVMVDGDIEANEREESPGNSVRFYTAVEQLFEETFGRLPVQFATGNHDIQKNMEQVFDDAGQNEYWHYRSKTGNRYNNYHLKINGIDFITLDYHSAGTYNTFLKDTLQSISREEDYDSGKPIFIQIHSGLSGTTTGSYQDCGNTAAYLQKTLTEWPQAVVMTAHSHYSAEVETGIYQKNFTVVNNGSMDYVEVDSTNGIENEVVNWVQGNLEDKRNELTCNYVTVQEDGTTIIRRFDVTNKRWMGIPWVIDTSAGKEGFRYTAEKFNKVSPWFENNDMTVGQIGETTADLTFGQAADDQLVEYYKITVRDFLTNEEAAYKVLPENADYAGNADYESPKGMTGSFKAYSRYYLRPYPEQMKFYFSGLQQNTRYRILVQAYDSFDNASKVQDIVFKTEGVTEVLPDTLPETIENGKFLDMSFDNSDLTDSEGQVQGEAAGNVTYEEGMKGKAAHVPAGNRNYISLGQNPNMNLENGGSLTINFWVKSKSTSGDAAVISNKNWNSGKNQGWYVGYRLSNLNSIGVNAADGSNRIDFDGYSGFSSNWKMVTILFDRENKVSKIYIDGRESSQKDMSAIGELSTDYPVKIGVDGNGGNGNADFLMDELQMWGRALTDEEIFAMYGTMVYEEDTTDYGEKLQELLEEAEIVIAEYESGIEGVYFDEKTAVRLYDEIAVAKNAQTKEEMQISCAELSYLIEKMRTESTWNAIDKSGFTVEACDSWHGDHDENDYGTTRLYAPEQAIDGNNSTAWHTNWSAGDDGAAAYPFPHYIIIDMKEGYSLSGIERLGRENRDYIKNFTVEISDNMEALISGSGEIQRAEGSFADKTDAFAAFGKSMTGRYIKVTMLDTYLSQEEGSEGKQWAYTAELNFTGHKIADERKITAVADANGKISPSEMTVLAGAEAKFTLIPNEGYIVKEVIVAGENGPKAYTLTENLLTIGNVEEDLSVAVRYEAKETVTPADKSQLSSAITAAQYILDRKENYQAATLEGLAETLELARLTAENPDALQEEINQKTAVLEKEIAEVRPLNEEGNPGDNVGDKTEGNSAGANDSGSAGGVTDDTQKTSAVETGDTRETVWIGLMLFTSGALAAGFWKKRKKGLDI